MAYPLLSRPSMHPQIAGLKRLKIAHIVQLLSAWLVKAKGLTELSYNAFVYDLPSRCCRLQD